MGVIDEIVRRQYMDKLRREDTPLEEPWLDPVTAFSGGFGGALPGAVRAGGGLMNALAKAGISGLSGAAMDYPIGQATEVIGQKYPKAAMPFNLLTGMLSGVTVEKGLEEAVNNPKGILDLLSDPTGAVMVNAKSNKFKKWFGRSKVVDETGEPLRVYHGTKSNITVFDKNELGDSTESPSAKLGFFFASDPDTAEYYSYYAKSPKIKKATDRLKAIDAEEVTLNKEKANIMKNISLSSEEKKTLRHTVNEKLDKLQDEVGAINKEVNNELLQWQDFHGNTDSSGLTSRQELTGSQIIPVYLQMENPLVIQESGKRKTNFYKEIKWAIENNHDGVIIKNVNDPTLTDVYVVFEPSQIKNSISE